MHDAANVLRRYLNQLPEPIVPLEFYERFREPLRFYQEQVQGDQQATGVEKFDHAKAVETYQQLIVALPPLNKQLLLYILDLLAVFASKSEQNRMTSANLSAIFQPGMLSHPQHDMAPAEYKLSQDVLIFLIENQDHFLVGMSGTVADEQQIKEVEAGMVASRPTAQSNASHVRRSVSSASASSQSQRKLESLRRNVSVSSRNSRTSNTIPSPGTPTSAGGGVHRSNTLPSKMGTVVTAARFAKSGEPGPTNAPTVSVSHQSSRSTSQAPSLREEVAQTHASQATTPTASGSVYVHTATHGPVPVATAKRLSIGDAPRPQENLSTPVPAPQVVTPTRERKLSNLFTKSPPGAEQKEPRQPNRLKKKRIPGSASISAQSSTNSLPGMPSELNLNGPADQQPVDAAVGDTTPKPPNSTSMSDRDAPAETVPTLAESSSQPNTENSPRRHQSRTPSMNSRSSFTDQSDYDQSEEHRSERREHRRSWRFHRSSKRSSEQIGLGLASPPLAAANPGAEQSSSSVGSGQNVASDPSSHPLSLDAGIQGSVPPSAEPEKRSLFGKFKAKVAQVRDGVKSPTQLDTDPFASAQTPSPTAPNQTNGNPSIETPNEPAKEESVRSPVSPLPGTGLPPAIPEEPNSPEGPPSAPGVEPKTESINGLENELNNERLADTATAESAAVAEASKESAQKESSS